MYCPPEFRRCPFRVEFGALAPNSSRQTVSKYTGMYLSASLSPNSGHTRRDLALKGLYMASYGIIWHYKAPGVALVFVAPARNRLKYRAPPWTGQQAPSISDFSVQEAPRRYLPPWSEPDPHWSTGC